MSIPQVESQMFGRSSRFRSCTARWALFALVAQLVLPTVHVYLAGAPDATLTLSAAAAHHAHGAAHDPATCPLCRALAGAAPACPAPAPGGLTFTLRAAPLPVEVPLTPPPAPRRSASPRGPPPVS